LPFPPSVDKDTACVRLEMRTHTGIVIYHQRYSEH